MRKEIDNIDTEMNNLFDKVKNITKTSSEINKSLETSREKIHKLNSVNLLLKKVFKLNNLYIYIIFKYTIFN